MKGFDDGFAKINGTTLDVFLARLLKEGRHRQAVEVLTAVSRSDQAIPPPGLAVLYRSMIRNIARWLSEQPEGARAPGKRGRPGRTMTREYAGKIDDARLALGLALDARNILDGHLVVDASVLRSFGRRLDPLDGCSAEDIEAKAREVLRLEKLSRHIPRKGFRAVYRKQVAKNYGVPLHYLQGVSELKR